MSFPPEISDSLARNLRQGSWFPGPCFERGPPDHEAGSSDVKYLNCEAPCFVVVGIPASLVFAQFLLSLLLRLHVETCSTI